MAEVIFRQLVQVAGLEEQISIDSAATATMHVGTVLAALIAGVELGMTPEQAAKGLSKYEPAYARLQLHQGRDGMTLVDDNFNANPDSTRMLLEEIPQFVQGRPERARGHRTATGRRCVSPSDRGRQAGRDRKKEPDRRSACGQVLFCHVL